MLRKCEQFVEETTESKENPREPKAAAVRDLRKPPEPTPDWSEQRCDSVHQHFWHELANGIHHC